MANGRVIGDLVPNGTIVPNVVFDVLMAELSGAELKVLLAVIRHTLGWVEDRETGRRREQDYISHVELCQITGLHSGTVSRAVASLVDKELIMVLSDDGRVLAHPAERQAYGRSGGRLAYRLNLRPAVEEAGAEDPGRSFPQNARRAFRKMREELPAKCGTKDKEKEDKEIYDSPPISPPQGGESDVSLPLLSGHGLTESVGQHKTLVLVVPGKRKRRKPNQDELPPAFASFWEVYPRKVGKQVALEKWRALLRQNPIVRADPNVLVRAARHYREVCEAQGRPECYILHPSTFLSKERWTDYVEPPNLAKLTGRRRPVNVGPAEPEVLETIMALQRRREMERQRKGGVT